MRSLLALLALMFLPAAAHAWWNDDWKFRKEITLDSSAAGANLTTNLSDVPVLIRLHAGNFGYFADTKPDGSDLRLLASDDKTQLKFHIERFDPTNQLAFVWVKVPQITGGAATDKIYLYYGNPKAPAASDVAGTYDAQQALVMHFADDKSIAADASAVANTAKNATADQLPRGLIAGGAHFEAGKSIAFAPAAALKIDPKAGATLSVWVHMDAPQTDAYVAQFQDGAASLAIGVNARQVFVRTAGTSSPVTAQSADVLALGEWHHVAATFAGGHVSLLVDGQQVASAAAEFGSLAGGLTLGAAADDSHPFIGDLDELQLAKVARSDAWLQAALKTQGAQPSLVVYGSDAQKEGGGTSYFRVTMQNVTPDGWVVIAILGVMFVVSMLVIVSKALYLSRVAGANRSFLKEFQKLKDDPTALDRPESEADAGDDALDQSGFMPHLKGGEDRYRVSTLYRLYHHGVQEMKGRVGLRSAGARAINMLTPQATAAMRAAMDATLVRMTQKISSQMVLLTIAISGGPFLGLLGTVVGVMITFAAIAASGDVNVNSIAPGIAAALVATVAGLGVAIPALFGYNWLNTRIKEINADMQVFVDEFVTRVAEHYS